MLLRPIFLELVAKIEQRGPLPLKESPLGDLRVHSFHTFVSFLEQRRLLPCLRLAFALLETGEKLRGQTRLEQSQMLRGWKKREPESASGQEV